MEDKRISDPKPSTAAAAMISFKGATKDERKSDDVELRAGGRKKKMAADFILKLESYFFEHTSSMQPDWFKALVDQNGHGNWVPIHEISKMNPHFPPFCPALRILLRKYGNVSKIIEVDDKAYMVRQRTDSLKAIDCGLFVDNLPPEADEKWVKDALNNYGPILAVQIPKRSQNCKNDGICFVYFSRCDAIEKIAQYFDRQSRIFAKLKKSGVKNQKERCTTAFSTGKVPSVEKIADQPLPLHIDMNDDKNSTTFVNDSRKPQPVGISSKSAEKSSLKRKQSAEKKSTLVVKSIRTKKRSRKCYVDDDKVIKEDRNRDQLESAIGDQLESAIGDQIESAIGDQSKSNARIVDGDRGKQSTSSSIDSNIKQDEMDKSVTKRNKQFAGINEFGEDRRDEKKHEMNLETEERDVDSILPEKGSIISSTISKTSYLADLACASREKMKRLRDEEKNSEHSKRKRRRSSSVTRKDSKDRKRRHAQSDDELITVGNHKRVKVERHVRRHRHHHHDQQTHPLSLPPTSSTKTHNRKKNFSRKRRYLKSRMQRRFALENLSVCTYVEWLTTKENYKKAQKAALSELKCHFRNRPLEEALEFKRGKDKWMQRANESMSKDVSNAS